MAYKNLWNWQQKDWPNFIYTPQKFMPLENKFLEQAGVSFGAFKHISKDERQDIIINFMSNEAMSTSKIEGEQLDRSSLQSSIKRQFGLKAPRTPNHPAENGISEMMIDLYHHYSNPLCHESLFKWHTMLMNGRRDITNIGKYREHEDTMQIISGADYKRKVHFEAPPSKIIPQEMNQFILWFNNTSPEGSNTLSPLTRACIAHLYFESIHPFEDGNGRIGRALIEKALSQSLKRSVIIGISEIINQEKKTYYKELAAYSPDNHIDGWIEYFANMILKAQQHSLEQIEFIIAKGQFMLRYANKMNSRQTKAILRIFEAGIQGFKGGLSAKNYMTITDAPSTTTTRDLNDLVNKGILTKTGHLKATRYWLNSIN
ncbi:MAG: Fic family protein [Alphaproteobacteria bacterium]